MKRRTFFTLIELLVVIAIIAILAAMLMPALSKARAKARSVVCINNLKTLGFSCRTYADEFGDLLPHSLGWVMGMANYLFCINYDTNPFANYLPPLRLSQKHYACVTAQCPDGDRHQVGKHAPSSECFSYGFSNSLVNLNNTASGEGYTIKTRLGRVRNPSGRMMLDELGHDQWKYLGTNTRGWAGAQSSREYYHGFRHSKSCGVLYVDQHVEMLPFAQMPESNTQSKDPGMFYKEY